MNSVNLQDTKSIRKNLLHFSILTINYQKDEFFLKLYLQLHQ